MVRLMMILLGVEYLRERWRGVMAAGIASALVGAALFVDALDGVLFFPIAPFAWLLLIEGLATLAVAWTGMGGQRTLRYVKGFGFCITAALVLSGYRHASFILSMVFATLFLADGLLQIASAWVVRYRTWRLAVAGGALQIGIAIFLYQPYPTHYKGTVPYCLGLILMFAGWNLLLLALRARRLAVNPAAAQGGAAALVASAVGAANSAKGRAPRLAQTVFDGPPAPHERALTVHVWTPVGSSRAEPRRQPLIDRYIAAVDRDGVISTGHAALESPERVYISLYPAVEIDRSPDEFTRTLRATRENDVPGLFQPDYGTESKAWCPSTRQVRIRNYDPLRLESFWERYREDTTYNLTHRNCSSTVSHALEAALEGATPRVWGHGWLAFARMLTTPELWVAAQVRKRGQTMAWTPGLTLDYARALSMLADPRPSGWTRMLRSLRASMLRRERRHERERRRETDHDGRSPHA
ncbi:HdeD family acid-resistance protein [Paraburkholderia nodosa]|uniref:HdeD family acid-resistance protein n=1 Tax=Paraburkholderia nodosa TaxID=392320 RepID=UPI0004AF07CA|nr:membrane protein [Paraburkholderia nodosa]